MVKRFIDGFRNFAISLWYEPILLALSLMLLYIPAESTEVQGWSLFVGLAFGLNLSNWTIKFEDYLKHKKHRQSKTQ